MCSVSIKHDLSIKSKMLFECKHIKTSMNYSELIDVIYFSKRRKQVDL